MFVDFDKVFNQKPQPKAQIPDAFITYLNRQLPDGFSYKLDENGNCVITSNGASFNLGGFLFTLTSEDRKILGKKYTRDDVLALFYNRQKPIPLSLKKDGYVLLNGKEFPIEKMFLNPHNPIRYESGSYFMSPCPFPDPFFLKVGCEGYERDLLVARVPHNSVHEALFESDKTAPLWVSYVVNLNENTLSMSISFNLANAKTIRDIVEATRIFNAYLDGKGYLCGHPLEAKLSSENVKRFEDSSAAFWEKVLAIEEHLNVSFTPPHEDVDFDTICLVEQLYQNLIHSTPIRETGKPDTLDGEWESQKNDSILSAIGSIIYFEFEATRTVELFGATFTLHGLMGILDAILSDLTMSGGKHRFVLKDASDDRPRFTASIFFKNESSMKAYKSENQHTHITAFRSAKKAREYVTEQ